MCCRKFVSTLFFLLVFNAGFCFQDSLKHRFSVGLGRVNTWYYFDPGPNEIVQKIPHGGGYLNLDFLWKRFGLSAGVQVMNRNYDVKYPDNHPSGILLYQHSSSITAVPLYATYQILDKRVFRAFIHAGIVYTKIHDDITVKYNNQPVYNKPQEKINRFFSWSTGLDLDLNLYKRDVWLSSQWQYVAEAENGNHNKRVLINAGLKIAVSNILYKDKIKTLKQYPVGK